MIAEPRQLNIRPPASVSSISHSRRTAVPGIVYSSGDTRRWRFIQCTDIVENIKHTKPQNKRHMAPKSLEGLEIKAAQIRNWEIRM